MSEKTKDLTKIISFTPQIHFSYLTFLTLNIHKITIKEFGEYCEELRIKAKQTGYTWDNSHFFIDNIFGNPILKFSIHEIFNNCTITFWNAKNGCMLKSYTIMPSQTEINTMLDNVTNDMNLCNQCGKWEDAISGNHYSFAGWVCDDCYDPLVHLPPDTRGD